MHGFGWLSQMCENLNFDNVSFTPAENYNVSSFADCIHICGCKGYVNITNSYFEHSHDDAINVHGAFLRLKKLLIPIPQNLNSFIISKVGTKHFCR